MPYTLEAFCTDCREALRTQPGDTGRETIRRNLERLLQNKELVDRECAPDRPQGTYRLCHDADYDFHVLAHCFDKGSVSPPHDHGPSWAVYGQARHHTDMTVWQRTDAGDKEGQAALAVKAKYRLNTGQAGTFNPGDIHSIDFPDGARFIRVTGTDLDHVAQAVYNLKDKTVKIASAGRAIDERAREGGATVR